MTLLTLLVEHSAVVWAVLSGLASGCGAMFIRVRRINASIERIRLKTNAEAAAAELAERAAFRAALMAEIGAVRLMMKECETEREALRERLATTEAQILVLKASNEIMEIWVAFFRDGVAPRAAGSSSASDRYAQA